MMDEQEVSPPQEAVDERITSKTGDQVAEKADELARLQQALEEESARSAEYLDQWRRTAADFANYRKRQEKERQQMADWAKAGLFAELLPVLDDLGRALDKVPAAHEDSEWVQGVRLVEQKMRTALEKAGLKEIEIAAGDPFDPTRHEALFYEESAEQPENNILQVLRKGYMLGERVLRAALVSVSKGTPSAEAETDASEPESEI